MAHQIGAPIADFVQEEIFDPIQEYVFDPIADFVEDNDTLDWWVGDNSLFQEVVMGQENAIFNQFGGMLNEFMHGDWQAALTGMNADGTPADGSLVGMAWGPITEFGEWITNQNEDQPYIESIEDFVEYIAPTPEEEEEDEETLERDEEVFGDWNELNADTLGQLTTQAKHYEDMVNPESGVSSSAINLRAKIDALQQGSDMSTRVQELQDAPNIMKSGLGPGTPGYVQLENAAMVREGDRDLLEQAVGDYTLSESTFATQKEKWGEAISDFGTAESTYEQAGIDVAGEEITDAAHKNDDFGFQENGEGPWYYFQTDTAGNRILDNAATTWIDESKYTVGDLGTFYAAQDAAGMDTWTWDGTQWITNEGMGAQGLAEAQWVDDQSQWALDQDLFNQGGEWYWQNESPPDDWLTIPGAEGMAPPDYDTTSGTGYWTRGTWGAAGFQQDLAIEDYQAAGDAFGRHNKSAWDIWKEGMGDISREAKGVAGSGTATADIRRTGEDLLRSTGMMGSGAIESATDLDLQSASTKYGEIVGGFTSKLGSTRRRLDETLATNVETWRQARSDKAQSDQIYSDASIAYGGAGDADTDASGIFRELEADRVRFVHAGTVRDQADTNLFDAGTAINQATGSYQADTAAYDKSVTDLRDAYMKYAPPTTEYNPETDFLADELTGLSLPEVGGQIYADFASAGSGLNTARGLASLEGFTLPEEQPYGDPSTWGDDYSSVDWTNSENWGSSPGGYNIPDTGTFGGLYSNFQDTTMHGYGPPSPAPGTDFTNMTGWGDAGTVYKDFSDYMQPGAGYGSAMTGYLGLYEAELGGIYDKYINAQETILGANPAAFAKTLQENNPSDEAVTQSETYAKSLWADYIHGAKGTSSRGGYDSSNSMQGLLGDWTGSLPDAFATELGDYTVQGASIPGYSSIEGNYNWRY